MTGLDFENQGANASNFTGFENLTLIFEGGSVDVDTFEVAGEDIGAMLDGLTGNFAIDTLQIGGMDVGQVQLVDDFAVALAEG